MSEEDPGWDDEISPEELLQSKGPVRAFVSKSEEEEHSSLKSLATSRYVV